MLPRNSGTRYHNIHSVLLLSPRVVSQHVSSIIYSQTDPGLIINTIEFISQIFIQIFLYSLSSVAARNF